MSGPDGKTVLCHLKRNSLRVDVGLYDYMKEAVPATHGDTSGAGRVAPP